MKRVKSIIKDIITILVFIITIMICGFTTFIELFPLIFIFSIPFVILSLFWIGFILIYYILIYLWCCFTFYKDF